jgi:hypothetical protein
MQIVYFFTAIAITFFLWVTLMYILSGIGEFISGMRSNKEALVAHGIQRVVVWLLIGAVGLYIGMRLFVHVRSLSFSL